MWTDKHLLFQLQWGSHMRGLHPFSTLPHAAVFLQWTLASAFMGFILHGYIAALYKNSRSNSVTSIKKKGGGERCGGEKEENQRKITWSQTLHQRMETELGFLMRAFWLYQLFTPPSIYNVVKTPNLNQLLQMNDCLWVSNTIHLSDDFLPPLLLVRYSPKIPTVLQNQWLATTKISFQQEQISYVTCKKVISYRTGSHVSDLLSLEGVCVKGPALTVMSIRRVTALKLIDFIGQS